MPGSRSPLAGAGTLGALLDDLRDAVGAEWVIDGGRGLQEYYDPYAVLEEDPFRPAAAVQPGSVDQVQEIVRLAGRHGRSLCAISTGRNLAYGGPAPGTPGAVVLDLRRLNQILEVNEDLGYALVEPGVTYEALAAALAVRGSRLLPDVPDLAWGGPVGNTLQRGGGYGPDPYGDHWDTHCGMEVVLPDGTLLRTGMGALPGSRAWQLFPHAYGPAIDGLFSQSSLGVVTKLGLWLRPRPPGYRPYMITVPREEDLGPVVEIMRELRLAGVMQSTATVRSLLLEAAATAARDPYYAGGGPLPRDLHQTIMADQGIGHWNVYGAQYGSQAVMEAFWAEIREAFGQIPGAEFFFAGDRPPGSVLEHRAGLMAGIPGMDSLRILGWRGLPGGHLNISPVCAATGEEAEAQYRMASELCRQYGVDYHGDLIVGPRAWLHIIMLIFNTESAEQKRACRDLGARLITDLAQAGWGVYRTHVAFADQVRGTYSYGGAALPRFLALLKAAIDPGGVLAPGVQ